MLVKHPASLGLLGKPVADLGLLGVAFDAEADGSHQLTSVQDVEAVLLPVCEPQEHLADEPPRVLGGPRRIDPREPRSKMSAVLLDEPEQFVRVSLFMQAQEDVVIHAYAQHRASLGGCQPGQEGDGRFPSEA